MVTEKDLSVEQRMAVSMAIDCMERNYKRNWNRLMYCGDIRIEFGQAINILTEMITLKENK